MARSRPRSWLTQLFDFCPALSATNNLPQMIHSASARWNRRITRGPLSFAIGKFPKSYFPEITPRSRSGEKSRRASARNKIGRIYCAINLGKRETSDLHAWVVTDELDIVAFRVTDVERAPVDPIVIGEL